MVLPLVKLGTLALRTVCKPIASRLKKEAGRHPRFRHFIINIAQESNMMNTEANKTVKEEQSPMNIASSSTTRKEEIKSPSNHSLQTRLRREDKSPSPVPDDRKIMTFGQYSLLQYNDNDPRRFRPLTRISDNSQQCLLDHIWNLRTIETERRYKQTVANSLAHYFSKIQQKPLSKNFFCYVVFRANYTGVFKHYNQVQLAIQNFQNPIFKGFYSLQEALNEARKEFGPNFYLDPDCKQSYSQITSFPPQSSTDLINNQASQLNDLQYLYQTSQAQIHHLLQRNQFLENHYQKTTYNQKTSELLEKRIEQLVQERDEVLARQPKRPRSLTYEQLSNHLKLKPAPILEELYERAGIDIKIKIEKMVFDRWTEHCASLQQLLKRYYQRFKEGLQFKVVQDRRSNMLRIRVDSQTLPNDMDEIVDLFHHGMLSRITFHNPIEETILERFGRRFALVASQYLKVFPGIMVNHRITTNIQRRLYGHRTDVEIRPLNEEKAVHAASELIGELFVFSVATVALIYEVQRSANSEAKKEEMRKQELKEILQRQEDQGKEIKELKQKLIEIEQLARGKGLPGIFKLKPANSQTHEPSKSTS